MKYELGKSLDDELEARVENLLRYNLEGSLSTYSSKASCTAIDLTSRIYLPLRISLYDGLWTALVRDWAS